MKHPRWSLVWFLPLRKALYPMGFILGEGRFEPAIRGWTDIMNSQRALAANEDAYC